MALNRPIQDQDNRPLLDHYGETSRDSSFAVGLVEKRKRKFSWLVYSLIAAYIPLISFCAFLYLRPNSCELSQPGVFPSLAQSNAIKFEQRKWNIRLHDNPFSGPPRPELDAAWHELFENIRIRVSLQDLGYYNLTSIPLADGSGFAAELGVHYELHCLKKIRYWIHKDYYLVNETESELVEWRSHIDHCMELMRLSIICNGDPSLSTFEWLTGNVTYVTAVAHGHHQCVDWDSLLVWVRERAIPIFKPGVLAGL